MILQVYYDIEKRKQKQIRSTLKGVPAIRRIIFWDTDFDSIDWAASKESVISRVLERGTEEEIAEIARYYGMNIESIDKYSTKSTYKVNGKRS